MGHRAGCVAAGPGCKGRLLRHRAARLLLPSRCGGHRLLGLLGPARREQDIFTRRWTALDCQWLRFASGRPGGGRDVTIIIIYFIHPSGKLKLSFEINLH